MSGQSMKQAVREWLEMRLRQNPGVSYEELRAEYDSMDPLLGKPALLDKVIRETPLLGGAIRYKK